MSAVHLGLAAATALLAVLMRVAHLPTPELFAGAIVGLAVALRRTERVELPRGSGRTAQAVLGVSIGGLATRESLREIGGDLGPVLIACLATLALSVVAGLLLTRMTRLDAATGSFGMIAGGASGVVAIAREVGADQRQVAVMQYLRVLVVVATVPIVAGFYPDAGGASVEVPEVPDFPDWLAFLALSAAIGLLLARVVALPAGGLLGPLIVGAVLTASGLPFAGPMPQWLFDVAIAVLGLQVGLSFTAAAVRQAREVIVPSLVLIVALIVVSAGLGALLSLATGLSAVDGYLATTPGGLYAVIAASVESGSDPAFVLAVQVIRVFLMLLGAPLLGRYLSRRHPG